MTGGGGVHHELLACSQLSIVSAEPGLDGIARTIAPCAQVGSREALGALLDQLLAAGDGLARPPAAKTLDLYGHSTVAGLLRLGDWVVDAADAATAAWWRALAERAVLPRLGVRALRLLACGTTATERGRRTVCALSELLGIEVFGTPHLLYDAHHDATGFRPEWRFLLVSSRELGY